VLIYDIDRELFENRAGVMEPIVWLSFVVGIAFRNVVVLICVNVRLVLGDRADPCSITTSS
jgi:hypothetical protein